MMQEINHQPGQWSDEALMERFVQRRNDQFFGMLYQRHYQSLARYLWWLSGDREAARDLTQDIFLKIYQKPNLFDPGRPFRVWLFVIAQNTWRNYVRQGVNRKKVQEQWLQIPLPDWTVDPLEERQEAFEQIRRALQSLSEKHQEVVLLKYSNNLSLEEIAGVLDCSTGTVKSRLFYALQKIKGLVHPPT